MNALTLNLLIAGIWGALAGEFTVTTLATGFALGFAALWALQPVFGRDRYYSRVPRLIRLIGLFLLELLNSSMRVAYDVLMPRSRSRPGIVAVPIRTGGEVETLLLSSMVSLTPGTLSLDLDADGSVLYVHALFADDPDEVRRDIRDGLETPLLEALR